MAVRFVIGRAGSGKTQRCLDAIVTALKTDPLQPPIYWILPRQATFQAERQLACESGIRGFSRVRVLSFDGLGREILADAGPAVVPEVDELGRQMILGFLLRKHYAKLRFFKGVALQAGLPGKLDATFAELERGGKGLADLDALLDELGSTQIAGDPLRDKILDLRLIYDAYTSYLGQERLDQHRRLLEVLRAIENSRLFDKATAYVDAFLEFTEYERRIVAHLGKVCRHVEINLLMDPTSPLLRDPNQMPADLSLFHGVETAYRRLWFTLKEQNIAVDDPVKLPAPSRFKTAGLTAIERQLFNTARAPTAPPDGIRLVEAPTLRCEVDAAARHIAELTAGGLRLRDIALLCRDLERYHELIDASFREHGIAYFIDRRRPTAHHPLLQFLRSLIALGDGRWSHEAIMTLLKTGLTGLDDPQADELENYVLRHQIHGITWESAQAWSFRRKPSVKSNETDPEDDDSVLADLLRRLVIEKLLPFVRQMTGAKRSVREIAGEFFRTLERFDIRKQLSQWIEQATLDNQLEERGQHEQVWAQVGNIFDVAVDLIGDEQLTLQGFSDVIETALEHLGLGLTPPTVDQVLVGQADRTRIGPVCAVMVLGLNEGIFPRTPSDDSVLSDSERRELRQKKLDVESGGKRRLLDENLLGYLAFTRASERVYASYSQSDAQGKALRPSPFWRRLTAIFPKATIECWQSSQQVEAIGTPRQLATGLMTWARTLDPENVDVWPAIYQWLTKQSPADRALIQLTQCAFKALHYTNQAALLPETSKRIFASPLDASAEQLESFARCPFQHFASFGLDLHQRADSGFTRRDMGGVFHWVLERVVRRMLDERQDWIELDDASRAKVLHEMVLEGGRELKGEVLLDDARNIYLLNRIEKTISRVLAAQKATAQRGKFRPTYARIEYGPDRRLPPLAIPTPEGGQILLHGSIDRVDLLDAADLSCTPCTVVDYRLNNDPLKLDMVYDGLSLRLMTSLLALQVLGPKLSERQLSPIAAFCVQMVRNLANVDHPDDGPDPASEEFDLRVKPRGIYDESHFHNFDGQTVDGHSPVVQGFVKKDGTLGNKHNTDCADDAELSALLAHVRMRIGKIGDAIMKGDIRIEPYRKTTQTACQTCNYKSVCRFETPMNRYRNVQNMKRMDVLQKVVDEQRGGKN